MSSDSRADVTPAAWLLPTSFHGLIWVMMFGRLFVFGPRYEKTFRDYGMVLPALTRVVMDVTRWMATYWHVAAMVLAAVIVVNAVVLWRLGGLRRRAGWLWTWMGGGLYLTLWAVVELAYLLPMWQLQEGLER